MVWYDHILPDLKIWLFKSQVSAAAGALLNSYVQYSTAFSLLDEKDVKLMGQLHSFRALSVTI
jgi:hypothetical protein